MPVGELELSRRNVDGDRNVRAAAQAGCTDSPFQELQGGTIGRQGASQAAFVGDQGGGQADASRRLGRGAPDPADPLQGFGEAVAPIGTTNRSWRSIRPPACAPPEMMFTIGSGSRGSSVKLRQSGTRRWSAAATAVASDTAKIALAPSRDMSGVSSTSRSRVSTAR